MEILLIYPPITVQERYSSDIGYSGGRQIPLGVFYLASTIRQAGHSVRVIDGEAAGASAVEIGCRMMEHPPDVVGISATTVAFHRALEMAREVKSRLPAVPVVIGGPHVTAAVHDVMRHPEIDIAVIGEGEATFTELLDAIGRAEGNLADVLGIAFRRGNETIVNPARPFISELDGLPFPAFDLIEDFSRYNPPPMNYRCLPVANIITSRGCPNQCTFCDRSVFGQRLRQRSPQNIAAEIELLWIRYHVREIAFVDDTFTINPERIVSLFRILDEKNIRIAWTCMSRINTVNEELLVFMKEHGCWHISFGIESGDEQILRHIRKNISLTNARRCIEICHRIGILTKGFFILGHPRDSQETMDRTIRLALELPLDDIVVTLNTPLPGTEQYGTAADFGEFAAKDWSIFNLWNPVFIPRGLTHATLLARHREIYRRFYLRPRIIFRYVRSFLSASGLRRLGALLRSIPFLLNLEQRIPQADEAAFHETKQEVKR
jgi:radical SAM superfamily enzyme YgiQ (UPF0313 family)